MAKYYIVSGGFDPIHEGHISLIKASAENSDDSASAGIRDIRKKYPHDELVFANGGDRGAGNIREDSVCKECNVQLAFGVGGNNKANSSSWLLNKWNQK